MQASLTLVRLSSALKMFLQNVNINVRWRKIMKTMMTPILAKVAREGSSYKRREQLVTNIKQFINRIITDLKVIDITAIVL